MSGSPFCSIIIPTIGRATLDRAVRSVLDQTVPQAELEVIVVNDSGLPLPDADWFHSPLVKILHTQRRERCIARNCGAAIARGSYLGFLDDDDWLLPGAIEHLWQLARDFPQALWLYGGLQVVNEKGDCLAEINSGLNGNCFAQILGGAQAPLQASLLQANSFFEIGGFNPAINGTEDEDLCRRFSYHGDFANTRATIACLFRGRSWSTSTNYKRAPQDTRLSRDLLLAEPNSLHRLMGSAKSGYWYGRICRIYWSLVIWNLKQGRLFRSLSRACYGLVVFLLTGKHLFNREFRQGVRAHHAPNTLHFVMKAYEQRSKITDKNE